DRGVLPESAVSPDLFSERVLIERRVFMKAQSEALLAEQKAMTEDGWKEVAVGARADVQDRLYSMDPLPKEFEPATATKLAKIDADQHKLEKAAEKLGDRDDRRMKRLQSRFDN